VFSQPSRTIHLNPANPTRNDKSIHFLLHTHKTSLEGKPPTMRTPRVAILALFFAASIFLLCRSVSSFRRSDPAVTTPAGGTTSNPPKSPLRSFFSFTGAFTLFPPNAAISLTDDNSTFFPARPAAFGPPLPGSGLSGQLWIGSGFTDDNLQDGESEGELGCSDAPGWEDGKASLALKISEKLESKAGSATAAGKTKAKKGGRSGPPAVDRSSESQEQAQVQPDPPPVDDGTDDYLHQGFQQAKRIHHETSRASGTDHADIQSIQEAAEITGKVVLLSRGGCGFLEKVKWAQRRGAIAVIVGDNQKGGPLIQMFARGNVDNVSIPSIFTSRTTAHLLSSLVQPGSFIADILDENGNPVLKVQQSDNGRKNKKAKQTTTATTAAPKATAKPKSVSPVTTETDTSSRSGKSSTSKGSQQGGWFWRLFHWGSGSASASDQSRPPSSGRLDWVMLDDWSDEKDRMLKSSLDKVSRNNEDDGSAPVKEKSSGDSFQIGVEDWRDPDLVGPPSPLSGQGSSSTANDMDKSAAGQSRTGELNAAAAKQAGKKAGAGSSKDVNGLKGGINTPGSGEYVPEMVSDGSGSGTEKSDSSSGSQGGLMSKIFGDEDEDEPDFTHHTAPRPVITQAPDQPSDGDDDDGIHHEGLWVTITPTSSASPFFDTLLVLVISPLITLTVVYALLILRAKIRRRRWRAPKSVVDRLPVRTYHTVAPSPIPSPRQPSPNSSSPTTPLLQGSSRPRPRPRSRTTTGVPEPADLLLRVDAALEMPRSPSRAEHEKGSPNISSEWKKYMGRQVECVVCLEEYVDGVSRVMSLPCGHEFHAECM